MIIFEIFSFEFDKYLILMQRKIMPRLTTTLKGTHGFRKTFLSTQRGHEALRMNRNGSLFYTGLYERETRKAGEMEHSPWLSSIQTFSLL